jgi:uncharacterized coiled-coil DUF342 family protein
MKNKPNNKKKDTKKKYDSLTQEEKEQLFKYYQDRKDEITKERYKWLHDVGDIINSINLFHEKEWELRKLSDKINELQINLSEANLSLIDERKKIMKYINEIENFRSKL